MKYPPFPQVGVGAIVIEGDNILLVKRANEPGKDKWSVPGGHLKLGESLYEAAVRELREETGIEGEAIGIINIDEYVEYDGKIRYHYVLIDVLIRNHTPLSEARPGGDAKEVGIFQLSESLNLNLTRSTRSLIEKLLRRPKLIQSNFIFIERK